MNVAVWITPAVLVVLVLLLWVTTWLDTLVTPALPAASTREDGRDA